MTTQDGYAIAVPLIRGQADQWDAQAPKLASIAQQVGTMRFQGYTVAGLFKGISDAHAGVIAKVHDRCDEGHAVFQKISESLRVLATRYEQMDHNLATTTDQLLRNGTPRIMVEPPATRRRTR